MNNDKSISVKLSYADNQWTAQITHYQGQALDHEVKAIAATALTAYDGLTKTKDFGELTRSLRPPRQPKMFLVFTISKNANSFGLYGHILVARDGETWEVARGEHLDNWKKGDLVKVRPYMETENDWNWAELSCEIPERKKDAPDKVLKELFPAALEKSVAAAKEYVEAADELDVAVKAAGFRDRVEWSQMIAAVDLTSPANATAFANWKEHDGTKAGLEKLI